jgi:DNA helicase-2/ATP-dependent DNA helicase PcrA
MPIALSPAQRRIIDYRSGHLQVIACAGSGKTETVARRIAALVAEGVEPSAIVAFTFTNAAAEALEARVHGRVKEALPTYPIDRLSPLYVGTIHAWSLRFLQENVPRYGTFELFEPHQVVALVLREYTRLGLDRIAEELDLDQRRSEVVDRFLQTAGVVENERLDARLIPDGPFKDSYLAYREMLEGYHVLTHDQCIARAVEALDDPTVFARYHAGLRHLVVDEFQDVNPAQAALVDRLGRAPVHVCVVGDDDQSIYQWRGSHVGILQSFQSKMRAHAESLDVNRRSQRGIVTLAADFAKSISPRLPKGISAHRGAGELEVHRFIAPTATSEAELVADAIAAMHATGTPYGAIAVLLRSVKTSSGAFREALDSRGIPWRCAGTTGLFLQPEAHALALVFALLGGRKEFYDAERRERLPVNVDVVAQELATVFDAKVGPVARWLRQTETALPTLRQVDLVGHLYELLEVLGVGRPAPGGGGPRLATLARFSQLLADFESAHRRLRRVHSGTGLASAAGDVLRGSRSDAAWAAQRFASYLSYYAQSAYEDAAEPLAFDVDAVTLSTVHQAKGLEWPVVFVPCLSTGRFPSRSAGKARPWLLPRTLFAAARYEGSDADERRLLYVAVTRARQHLYLSTHAAVTSRRVKPSPYFLELGGGQVKESSRPLPVPSKPCAAEGPDETRPTFSLSELTAWLKCPMAYRLRLELGFQPRAAKELGYGKAVHHVLRRVAEETQRTGRVPPDAFVREVFEREFFLPYADKAALGTMRPAAERLVRRYLKHHGDDLLKTWGAERSFVLQLPEAQVTGRADVILEESGALTLLDYKTNAEAGQGEASKLQLAAYAAAASGEGLKVAKAFVHDLSAAGGAGREEVGVEPPQQRWARGRLGEAVEGIRARRFEAKPGPACKTCDVCAVCSLA